MTQKNSKFLISIIIALAVIIVALAVMLVIILIPNNGKQEGTVIETTIADETTQSQEQGDTASFDISKYPLGTYYIEGEVVEDIMNDGGTYLEITDLNENDVSFTYSSISAAPANRIADIIIEGAEIIDGKAEFTFDNDGWYNRGTGYIEFKEDGKIEIYVDITRMSEDAMFNIRLGTQTLIFDHE